MKMKDNEEKKKVNGNMYDISSIKRVTRSIWKFHVVVGKTTTRNVQKGVLHVQSCCFANSGLP